MLIVIKQMSGEEFHLPISEPASFVLDPDDAMYIKRNDGNAYAILPVMGVESIKMYIEKDFIGHRPMYLWEMITAEEFEKVMETSV